MPYVDDGCNGDCDDAKMAEGLQAIIDDALMMLERGDVETAKAILSDGFTVSKSPATMRLEYKLWQEGNLAGFTVFDQRVCS